MDSNRYIKPKRWWTNVGGHVFTFSGRPVWQEKDIFQWVSCGVSCRCSAIVLIEFSRVFYYLPWNAVFPFSWTWTCQTAHTHTLRHGSVHGKVVRSRAEVLVKLQEASLRRETKLRKFLSQFSIQCCICPTTKLLPGVQTLAVRSEEAWQAGDVSERHGSILCISESLQQLFFESCKVAFLHGFAEQVTDGDGMMTLADLRMGRLETPSTLCSLLFSIKPKETRRRCSLVEWCGMLPSYSTHQSNWCLHLYPTMGMYIDSLSRPL